MVRSFDDLMTTGVLWFANSVLHQRQLAIALVLENGHAIGWDLVDASSFDEATNAEKSAAFEALCAAAKPPPGMSGRDVDVAALLARIAALEAAAGGAAVVGTATPPAAPSPSSTTIGAPLGSVLLERPQFARAAFAASHASNADPNPVTADDGTPNGGARW